jgi:hypothetical protein
LAFIAIIPFCGDMGDIPFNKPNGDYPVNGMGYPIFRQAHILLIYSMGST